MIIACPGCNKQYKLDPAKVKYTVLPGSDKAGVQLACSRCRTQWWQPEVQDAMTEHNNKTTDKSSGFRSFTDLTNLEKSSLMSAAADTFAEIIPRRHTDDDEREPQPAGKSGLRRLPPLRGYKSLLLALAGVIGVMSAVGVTALLLKDPEEKETPPKPAVLAKPAKRPPAAVTIDPLIIEDVKYVQSRNNESQRVDVGGQVINPNAFAVPVPSLMIIVLGTCPEGRPPEDQGLCVLKKWQYKWKKTEIPAEESVLFEDSAVLDPDAQIKQVDVDIIESETVVAAPDNPPAPPAPRRADPQPGEVAPDDPEISPDAPEEGDDGESRDTV